LCWRATIVSQAMSKRIRLAYPITLRFFLLSLKMHLRFKLIP
jgi:hypothetical protein